MRFSLQVPALAAAFRDENIEVRRAVIHAIGEIEGASATATLAAAMKDSDPEIRREAARALGERD